ncbi:SDR family NAD(P)-dependent oxidoreductase [Ensifer soli]|uniref:SDR family NAD(P)-dependent oxidoreductase n=1 Tax=Ciceribacter sp. sgz301302 TaxID=3342379 RepID=UPI0035BB03A3
MAHPAFSPGNTALVTGAASGIGRAAAERFAALGLHVVMVDLAGDRLDETAASVARSAKGGRIAAMSADVSDPAAMATLAADVAAAFGPVHVLMNNAGIQPGSALFGDVAAWDRVLAVNLHGVINGVRAFGPEMIAHGAPGAIINTGSKQGITTPPGDPAYNLSKAGVKVFTEAVAHDLRNRPDCRITAHLLIPGFVFTPLAAGGRTEKPADAWTPEQTVGFMMERLERGDFYILCPDNAVDRATDEKRILWAAGDIVENRPPLSRWHPDHAAAFAAHLAGDKS